MIKQFKNGCLPVRNLKGDWSDYLPNPEWQVSLNDKPGDPPVPVDSYACVSFSAIHCIETQIKFLIGQALDYSERALAELSGTTKQGNYIANVYDAIAKNGAILDSQWPTIQKFDWPTFYAQIPSIVIASGKGFLKQWELEFYSVGPEFISQALKSAPLHTLIPLSAGHAVEMINSKKYFDSYAPWVKDITQVKSYYLIYLKEKSMTLGFQKEGDPTVYVQTGNKLVPLADWPAFVNLGGDATSIITLTPDQFSKFEVVNPVLFKSNQ